MAAGDQQEQAADAASDSEIQAATWSFLKGGGDLGERIRRHDWSQTALGAPDRWPHSLKTTLQIMLSSGHPIWVGWGSEFTFFYNEALGAGPADA